MKDREPTKILENGALRYGVYDDAGALLRYEYIKPEDEPTEEGTPLNKATLLSDATVEKVWPNPENRPVDPTVNQALAKLAEPAAKVGDIKITGRSDLGDAWIECDGRSISQSAYPDLYAALRTAKRDTNWALRTTLVGYVFTSATFAEGMWVLLDQNGAIFTVENPETGDFSVHTELLNTVFYAAKILYEDGYYVVLDASTCIYVSRNIGGPWVRHDVGTTKINPYYSIFDITYDPEDHKWYVASEYSYRGIRSLDIDKFDTPELNGKTGESLSSASTNSSLWAASIFFHNGILYNAWDQGGSVVVSSKNGVGIGESSDFSGDYSMGRPSLKFSVIDGNVLVYDQRYYAVFNGETGIVIKDTTEFPMLSSSRKDIISIKAASGNVLIVQTDGIYRAASLADIRNAEKEVSITATVYTEYSAGTAAINGDKYLVAVKNDSTGTEETDIWYEDYSQLEKFIPTISADGANVYIKALEE